jgi:hypothetical protein
MVQVRDPGHLQRAVPLELAQQQQERDGIGAPRQTDEHTVPRPRQSMATDGLERGSTQGHVSDLVIR